MGKGAVAKASAAGGRSATEPTPIAMLCLSAERMARFGQKVLASPETTPPAASRRCCLGRSPYPFFAAIALSTALSNRAALNGLIRIGTPGGNMSCLTTVCSV